MSDAEQAGYARRPHRMTLAHLQKLSKSAGVTWGTLSLPISLSVLPSEESARLRIESAWTLIEPLVTLLKNERVLDRNRFSSGIHKHAARTGVNFRTLRRLLLRYYLLLRMQKVCSPVFTARSQATRDRKGNDRKRFRIGDDNLLSLSGAVPCRHSHSP